jgi:hypothetical protein
MVDCCASSEAFVRRREHFRHLGGDRAGEPSKGDECRDLVSYQVEGRCDQVKEPESSRDRTITESPE